MTRPPRVKPYANAKLTVRQVLAIRAAYAKGAEIKALAKRYGRGQTTIHFICHRLTWRWLPPQEPSDGR